MYVKHINIAFLYPLPEDVLAECVYLGAVSINNQSLKL